MSPNAATGPLVLMCHGWPELWYSWRHQLKALARGGLSRGRARHARLRPHHARRDDVAAYTILHNVGDMVALVAALGETRALIVGHDWGAPVAWHAALMRPDIFPAVVAMSVPHRRRGRAAPLETLKQAGKGDYYWIYFQERAAEDEFARDARYTMQRLFHIGFGDTPREDKMSLYVDRAKGFLGPPRDRAAAAVADARPTSTCSRPNIGAPAFAAGSTGIATSTATGS